MSEQALPKPLRPRPDNTWEEKLRLRVLLLETAGEGIDWAIDVVAVVTGFSTHHVRRFVNPLSDYYKPHFPQPFEGGGDTNLPMKWRSLEVKEYQVNRTRRAA